MCMQEAQTVQNAYKSPHSKPMYLSMFIVGQEEPHFIIYFQNGALH